MRLLLADVLFCCWVIFGLLVFFGFLGVMPYAPTARVSGFRSAARVPNVCENPLQQGAERVRNIHYDRVPNVCGISPCSEGAQCVKMPLHIPLKALWGQNRDGGDEVRLGLQPLRGC